ncbi:hypothetical protein RD792_007907 [Penstemon davidsonii]|uniref:F-box domain-containing protein n=1 Tax=Penstemon davidsonii TaxID=160366 RepID=A0ABR0D8F2_9LAMI|nr:hypothetical protein RD792_007907 [Penstemon davidsonii]
MANQDNETSPLSLPEDCIAVILSFTSPEDACRAAALWERFLPSDYKNIIGRFDEVAHLLSVWWLEISGIMQLRMLSPRTTYEAYLVFKLEGSHGLDCSAKASIKLVKENSATESEKETNIVYIVTPTYDRNRRRRRRRWMRRRRGVPARDAIEGRFSRKRLDGWMELELGEFFIGEELDEGEVQSRTLGN